MTHQQINTTIPVELLERIKRTIPQHGLTMRQFAELAFGAALELLETGTVKGQPAPDAEVERHRLFGGGIQGSVIPAATPRPAPAPKAPRANKGKPQLRQAWISRRHDSCPGWTIEMGAGGEVAACKQCLRFTNDFGARKHVKDMWFGQGLPFHTEVFWLSWGMHPRDKQTAKRLWNQDSKRITALIEQKGNSNASRT